MKQVLCCQRENSNKNPVYFLGTNRLKLLPDYLTCSPKPPTVLHQTPLLSVSIWSLPPGTVQLIHLFTWRKMSLFLLITTRFILLKTPFQLFCFLRKTQFFFPLSSGQQSLEHSPPCFQYQFFIRWSSFSPEKDLGTAIFLLSLFSLESHKQSNGSYASHQPHSRGKTKPNV